ncbi:MAG: hypothetical protein M3Q65_00705 [Chloroflexota bacterium]|nr:hypothetical protein [Chloroflexota bacterium]
MASYTCDLCGRVHKGLPVAKAHDFLAEMPPEGLGPATPGAADTDPESE